MKCFLMETCTEQIKLVMAETRCGMCEAGGTPAEGRNTGLSLEGEDTDSGSWGLILKGFGSSVLLLFFSLYNNFLNILAYRDI